MIFQGTLANVRGQSDDEFLNYLIEQLPFVTFYRFAPPEGQAMAAKINWRGVLHDTAALLTVSTVLWNAYVKFVEPNIQTDKVPSPAMIIQTKDSQGNSLHFVLGKEYKDKDIFIQSFQTKMKNKESQQSSGKISFKSEEIDNSSYWIEIK